MHSGQARSFDDLPQPHEAMHMGPVNTYVVTRNIVDPFKRHRVVPVDVETWIHRYLPPVITKASGPICEGVYRSSQRARAGHHRADVAAGHAVFKGAVALGKLGPRRRDDLMKAIPDEWGMTCPLYKSLSF